MVKDPLTAMAQAVRSKVRILRFLRFLVVGGSTSFGYVIAVAVLVDRMGISEQYAAGIAYLLMFPVNFLGHKLFTYQSNQRPLPEGARFVAMHGVTAAICAGIMWIITAQLEATHWLGSAAIVLIAPAVNYIMMETWVFAGKEKHLGKRASRT